MACVYKLSVCMAVGRQAELIISLRCRPAVVSVPLMMVETKAAEAR